MQSSIRKRKFKNKQASPVKWHRKQRWKSCETIPLKTNCETLYIDAGTLMNASNDNNCQLLFEK
jgi:hypothetical protein